MILSPITSIDYMQMRPVKRSNIIGIWIGCRIEASGKQLVRATYMLLLYLLYCLSWLWIGHISRLQIFGGAVAPPAPSASWGLMKIQQKNLIQWHLKYKNISLKSILSLWLFIRLKEKSWAWFIISCGWSNCTSLQWLEGKWVIVRQNLCRWDNGR